MIFEIHYSEVDISKQIVPQAKIITELPKKKIQRLVLHIKKASLL